MIKISIDEPPKANEEKLSFEEEVYSELEKRLKTSDVVAEVPRVHRSSFHLLIPSSK